MNEPQYVTLKVDDGTSMRAYIARPQGKDLKRGLMVFQEAFGVNDHIRDVTRRFAAQGYLAVAPELFHRSAPPGFETGYSDFSVVVPHLQALTVDGLMADARATHRWLTSEGGIKAPHTGCVGYCMGGRASFLANSAVPVAAAISYYGGGMAAPEVLARASHLNGSHLFCWGGKDKHILPEHREAVVNAVREAGKSFINVEFGDADHAFACDQRGQYHAASAHEAWALTLAFLDQKLG